MKAERVLHLLRSIRVTSHATEAELHRLVETALRLGGEVFQHEVRLGPRNRIDFLVDGGIGIEIKRGKPPMLPLVNQLTRYAASPRITELVVVVERNLHRSPGPTIYDKPIHYVALNKQWGISL